MSPFAQLEAAVRNALRGLMADGRLPASLDLQRVSVDPPRDERFGEVATNAAMVLAKAAGQRPMDIAASLGAALERHPEVASAEPAPPGFVNLRMRPGFWQAQIPGVLAAGADYGRSDIGRGVQVNVEYCSANPT